MATAVETRTAATEAVARFMCERDLSHAPSELFDRATWAIIDTVGVTIAGRREDSFRILAETLGESQGQATVLPTRARTSAAQAALLNGTAGHALDYDDVADEITGHPSVVLVSALLALAEANGNTGRDVLEAFVVGFEVDCAIASALPVGPHYTRGWHATATIGTLGGATAAGRLLHLDVTRMRNALGIAASMASGSRQNFGTMTKPLHAGLAARDAVLSARLAANGFTADENQLEGPLGFFQMYGSDSDPAAVATLLDGPGVLLTHGLNVKKYPCCYGTHRAADAALALRDSGIRAADVRSVAVTLQPGGQQAIIHHRPQTGLQGKFSCEYVVAACLLDGRVGLSTFTDQAVTRADAQSLLQRVSLQEDAVPPFGPSTFNHAYACVEVTLSDGSTVRQRCDIARGDARAPLGPDEQEAKFRDCLQYSGSDWNADSLLERLLALRSASEVLIDPTAAR